MVFESDKLLLGKDTKLSGCPIAGFTEDTSGTFNAESWITTTSDQKRFYYVKAVN